MLNPCRHQILSSSRFWLGNLGRLYTCKKGGGGGGKPPSSPSDRSAAVKDVCQPPKCDDKAIERVECMPGPCCPDPPALYDEIYRDYLCSLTKKKFSRTWWECPDKIVVKKIVCDTKKTIQPPTQRTRMVEKDLSCPDRVKSNIKCPKITCPGCCRASGLKKIRKNRCFDSAPKNCKKLECPFPSYSECRRYRIPDGPPTECDCAKYRSLCELLYREGKIILRYGSANALKPKPMKECCD